ncbi:hypothetical protein Jann_1045 [Jannaschia sp. CCS1]|nr:hypothetical protein Jann_1045 [Jannaschia sp. CCS1]
MRWLRAVGAERALICAKMEGSDTQSAKNRTIGGLKMHGQSAASQQDTSKVLICIDFQPKRRLVRMVAALQTLCYTALDLPGNGRMYAALTRPDTGWHTAFSERMSCN